MVGNGNEFAASRIRYAVRITSLTVAVCAGCLNIYDPKGSVSSTGTSTSAEGTATPTEDTGPGEETNSPTDSGITTGAQTVTTSAETDVTTTPGPICGNDVCEEGEDSMNCEGDCPVPDSCGNDVCDPDQNENFWNCPGDCPAVCGNDVVEDTEECDDGMDGVPTESADCNANCTASECGDGVMNTAAGEVCDDGNTSNTDACVMCQPAVCGDGQVQDGVEECDDGDADDNACNSMCEVPRRTVFVTSKVYNGNLMGLSGADAKCQERADTAMLGGQFKAWLSDGAINMDESGVGMIDTSPWSNTDETGAPKFAKHCLNWTSSSGGQQGPWGDSTAVDIEWTVFFDAAACSINAPLYCFEDGM
jgi:cysteine-rich repeat protein